MTRALDRALGDRGRTERALSGFAGKDERYRLMVAMAPSGIALLDLDGLILDVNPAIERLLGVTYADVVGKPCEPFTHPDDHARERPLLTDTLEGRRDGYTIEKRYVRRDGSIVWANLAITLIRDERGRPSQLLALIENIDDRHQLDEALRESESRYRSIFHESRSGIALLTPGGTVVQANAACAALLGRDRRDLKGHEVGELVAAGDRAASQVEPGGQHRYERRIEREDGTHAFVDVRLTAITDGSDQVRFLLAILDDVTERKRLEEERHASAETLRNLIATSPLAIVSLDRTGRVLLWNEAAEEMYGWEAAEVIGQPLPTVPPEAWPSLHTDLAAQFEGRAAHRGTKVTRRRKNGSPVEIEVWTSPLRDADGVVVAQVSLQADTSERRQLEQRLAQSERLEALGKLAGGVAHDFDDLITAIAGHAEAARRMDELPLPAREELAAISGAAERAADVVRQLLALSGNQVLEPSLLDLNDVVSEVEQTLRHLIGPNVRLDIDQGGAALAVVADRGQLMQVLVNLVVNARDAMPEGGDIAIVCDVAALDEQEAERAHCRPGAYSRIRVSDTGTGMDEATRARVFEPFFTTKGPGYGTGLGLATSYGIVAQSGGTISVASELGVGTTFTILLPHADRSGDGSPEQPAEAAASLGAAPVRLVEEGPASA